MKRVGQRKTRSDKKKDVKPTLGIELKDAIYRLSYIVKAPVKDVVEWLVLETMSNQKAIVKLVGYFKRDYMIDNTLYVGNYNRDQYPKLIAGPTEKITTRFTQRDYALIYDLAYALELSPSRVVAVLIDLAMSDIPTINKCLKTFTRHEFSDNDMKEFNKLNKYVRKKALH